jgi:hypothetical protein
MKNLYSVYVNEPLYCGNHPCLAKGVDVRKAIKVLYDARKRYKSDPENNESHGFIIWENVPEYEGVNSMVYNMHFDSPNCDLNWQILRYITRRRSEIVEDGKGKIDIN